MRWVLSKEAAVRGNASQTEMALLEGPGAAGPGGFVSSGDEGGGSLFGLVNDRLSGRWLWMIVTAVVLGLGLGAAGYLSAAPTYRSDGAIRITPRLPVILGETPEHRLDFFSQFVATQMHLIKSRRVVENAMSDPDLTSLPFAKGDGALDAIQDQLLVESDRNSELIAVSFEHTDPAVSQAVVNAVMRSYFDIYGKAEGAEVGRTLETLYEHQDQLSREMRAIRQDIGRIRTRHEAADLHELQSLKMAKVQELEAQIAVAEMALAQKAAAGQEPSAGEAAVEPTAQQLELIDPKLVDLRILRDTAETEFRMIQATHKSGTPVYRQAERRLNTAQSLFEEELARATALWQQYGPELLASDVTALDLQSYYASMSAPLLREEITRLLVEAGDERDYLQTVITDLQTLDDKEYEKTRIQTELDHVTTRIQQLELNEASIVKRITIAQEGFKPRGAYDDPRKKRAVMGLGFGCMVSFGAFFLWGTVDRRTYATSQLSSGAGQEIAGCLGVLPDLGQSATDPEASEMAAHCVHQIRNQIEAIRDPKGGFVLAVTSPFQGDGKTSIVMALGWSYAAAGYNTLLVDCDLVGRNLTRQLGLTARMGLREALRDRQLGENIASVPIANVHALPSGIDSRIGPESVRRIDLEDLFAKVKTTYDIIIVDTGPMLGSLESTPVTASADGVVLSVRRGRSRTRLEECRNRLRTLGARCIGVILNYAVKSDCNRYVSEASIAMPADEPLPDSGRGPAGTRRGDRNVLMLAMEQTSRESDTTKESDRVAS